MVRSQASGIRGPAGLLARELLLAWLGFFTFLSIDVVVRVIGIRGQFENQLDAFALVAIEACRAATLLIAVWLAGTATRQAGRNPAAGLLAVLIAFAAIWYARAIAFSGFPGHVQESLARWLLGAGAPPSVLRFIFGSPEWSAWIALGALLRLSAAWPRRLDPVRIAGSGTTDRRGMMRSVAFAGADIGAGFRRLAAGALATGLLEPGLIWPAVIVAGTIHSVVGSTAVYWGLGASFGAGAALAITNLRATFAGGTRRQRERILWGVNAAVIAAAAFLSSGTLSFGGDGGSTVLGMAIASLAPVAVLLALAPVVRRQPPPAGPWFRRVALAGASLVTGSVAYVLAIATLPAASPELPIRELVALATSVVLVVVSAPRLRDITNRIAPPLAR